MKCINFSITKRRNEGNFKLHKGYEKYISNNINDNLYLKVCFKIQLRRSEKLF
jgi:hypothetical protein